MTTADRLDRTAAPTPAGAESVDELAARLRALQAWSGLSYREIHRRVLRSRRARGVPELPALDTVHRCLKPGRTRLDADLVAEIAAALLGDGDPAAAAEWRQALRYVSGRAAEAAVVSVLHGLPGADPRYVGRSAELQELLASDATVTVIEGMAGVGKTTLATYAARRLVRSGRYAGLQLSVNLRGRDPTRPPADPCAVLDAMLRRLDCPPHQIHALDLDGRSARFRELMTGRHALLLLDDAANAEQVRPLLPAGDTCRVLVTSRRRLTGLPGARLRLEVFDDADALELLRTVAGAARIGAEQDAAVRIAGLVGHLPLAVALVAGRIVADPGWTIGDHLTRLAERQAGLSLEDGVTVAIQTSYDASPPPWRRMLRLLAVHPGRAVDAYAAAALAGCELEPAQQCLAGLAADHLLLERAAGRYELHDLVRVFAGERALDVDPSSSRRDALNRLQEYYRYTADTARRSYAPHTRQEQLSPRPRTPVPAFADAESATGWTETELPNLMATALAAGLDDEYVADVSRILARFLLYTGHHQEAELLHDRASRIPGFEGARALARLGVGYDRLGRHDEAADHYRRALPVIRAAGRPDAEASVLMNHGVLCLRTGSYAEALKLFGRSIAVYREIGKAAQVGHLQCNIGDALIRLGRVPEAITEIRAALATARELSDLHGQAVAIADLGLATCADGRPRDALELFEESRRLLLEIGDTRNANEALAHIGDARLRCGDDEQSLGCHQEVLATARELGDRDREVVALNGIGRVLRYRGEPGAALEHHLEALTLVERAGNRWEQALTHEAIALARTDLGEVGPAAASWQQALDLHRAMGTPDAARIEAGLG